jgi:hypothetical protein
MSNILRPAFVKSIQRLECIKCGAEANASCNCGTDYRAIAERVREYDEANPGKSTRAAAADLGVSQSAIQKARQSGEHQYSPVPHGTPEDGHYAPGEETVVGLDGKRYPSRSQKRDETGPTNQRNVFLMNCAAAIAAAQTNKQYNGPVDDKIRAAARRVADNWKTLADAMEGL